MDRREFISRSCSLCAMIGSGMLISGLESCSTTNVFRADMTENKIAVPVSLFETSNLQMVRVQKMGYDIALRKLSDGNFVALQMKCTHADNQLVNAGNSYSCHLHGSRFDEKGMVTKGPAERPLKRYRTEVLNSEVIIYLD